MSIDNPIREEAAGIMRVSGRAARGVLPASNDVFQRKPWGTWWGEGENENFPSHFPSYWGNSEVT